MLLYNLKDFHKDMIFLNAYFRKLELDDCKQ